MDIFSPVIATDKQHPSFREIFVPRNRYALDVLNDWARGFVDRDGKFVKEFQISFNSSFWELYLFAVLKHYGYQVSFKFDRPDFVVDVPVPFCIEATVAQNDVRTKAAHEAEISDIHQDLNVLNHEAVVRLSNSFASKYKKYASEYSALPHVSGKPFVIAIAPFDRPFFYMQCQRAIEALLYGYYVDEDAFIKEGDFNKPLGGAPVEQVINHNGSPIQLGLFNDPCYKEVSAVVFSSTATWGKAIALSNDPNSGSIFTALKLSTNGVRPHIEKKKKALYSEHLLDGLRVYHNPHAVVTLEPDVFRDKRVFQTYYDFKAEDWIYEQHDGQLLFRTVNTVV